VTEESSFRRTSAPALAMTPYTFQLESFQGPLEVLLALVQRREVDVYRIQLLEILRQYSVARSERPRIEVDLSAEMLALSATLLLIKCRALLAQAPDEDVLESFLLPSTELLENLVHYCQFKAISEQLAQREASQLHHYTRPPQSASAPAERPPLEPVEADELREVFRQVLAKAAIPRPKIADETWRLPDVIKTLEQQLVSSGRVPLLSIVERASSRSALIVLFLALLELMKRGQISILRESGEESPTYWLTPNSYEPTHRSSHRRGCTPEKAGKANS
jgi:segregation and condensation protein A